MIEAVALAVACGRVVTHVSVRPPAPIVARTGCGTFLIGPDGSVRRRRVSSAPTWAPGAESQPERNTWISHPHGRLAVYRAGRLLWRSRIRNGTDNVAVRGDTIAFSVWGPRTPESLWIAQVGGRERFLGRREEPIAWSTNGLMTQRRDEIRVRAQTGRLVRIVARGHSPVYDAADGTVLLVSRAGALLRTDGLHVWQLAHGFRSDSWVQLLDGRVIDVTTDRNSVFLRANGSRLAVNAPLGEAAAAMGGVIALPRATGIVYVVNRGRTGTNPGANFVYVTQPHAPLRLLYRRRVPRLSCGEWAGLSYDAGRVLYTDDQGPLALLDPRGRRHRSTSRVRSVRSSRGIRCWRS